MNENYLPDIEAVVDEFRKEFQIEKTQKINNDFIKKILFEQYNYAISTFESEKNIDLAFVDLIWKGNNKIVYNDNLPEKELTFLLAKELGFQLLKLSTRPNSYPILKVDSFEGIFNNFKATYFARALLINKEVLVGRLTYLLASPKWDSESFLATLSLFDTSPSVFVDRVTNLLSGHFGLNNLFLLGMQHDSTTNKFNTVNEMHLRQLHSPHGYARNEHYCRRWLGLNIINKLESENIICESQISEFSESSSKYFVISVAYFLRNGQKRSDTIGFVLDNKLKTVLNFVGDTTIKKQIVNQTCERCGINNCAERIAAPIVYEAKINKIKVIDAVARYKG
jgi:XRE family transcriptional regulator, fatty acid utilization regulator